MRLLRKREKQLAFTEHCFLSKPLYFTGASLSLAFAKNDNRMRVRVRQVRDGAGDAGHLGGNDVDWPSTRQSSWMQSN